MTGVVAFWYMFSLWSPGFVEMLDSRAFLNFRGPSNDVLVRRRIQEHLCVVKQIARVFRRVPVLLSALSTVLFFVIGFAFLLYRWSVGAQSQMPRQEAQPLIGTVPPRPASVETL